MLVSVYTWIQKCWLMRRLMRLHLLYKMTTGLELLMTSLSVKAEEVFWIT